MLVFERVTKSVAKWKKWWLKRSISKGTNFGRNDNANHIKAAPFEQLNQKDRTTEPRKSLAIIGNSIVLAYP